jgi:peptide/nickel transport system permease protein
MLKYILTRLMYLLPMLLLMSLLAFVLSISAPGDPVERLLTNAENAESGATATRMNRSEEARKLRKTLGLDLPSFYFSIQTKADIDTLHKIDNLNHIRVLRTLARESGKPSEVMVWYYDFLEIEQSIQKTKSDTSIQSNSAYRDQLSKASSLFQSILISPSKQERQLRIDSISMIISTVTGIPSIGKSWNANLEIYNDLNVNAISWKKYVPTIQWYGIENQYHRWLFGANQIARGAIRGDFGISYRDGQRISDRLIRPLKWSLSISLIAIFIAFALSIPIGLLAGRKPNSMFDKISSSIVFAFYALPGFFVATLLLVFFANPDFLDWLPSSGIKDPEMFNSEWTLGQRLLHYLPYVILPIVSLSYASFAFISRQVRSGVIEAYKADYVRTAKSKGLSESAILLKHILPNILFPLITLFGQILPLLLGGSIIIESIFSIPGMGLEIYESVVSQDYPMIVAIFTLMGLMTMLGYLISDVLYAIADPRVNYLNRNS